MKQKILGLMLCCLLVLIEIGNNKEIVSAQELTSINRITLDNTEKKECYQNLRKNVEGETLVNSSIKKGAGKKPIEAVVTKKKDLVKGWYIQVKKKYFRLSKAEDIGLYDSNNAKLIYHGVKKGTFSIDEEDDNLQKDIDNDIDQNIDVEVPDCIENTDSEQKEIIKPIKQTIKVNGIPINSEGECKKAIGLYKIGKQYYFIRHGKLQTKDYTYKKVKYYINLNGTVACYNKDNKWYTPSGKKMSSIKRLEEKTRIHARVILRSTMKSSMTKKEKLDACFWWVVKNYSYFERPCDGKPGWTSKQGDAMIVYQSGDCRTLAAGFAFLASEVGYKNVYICQDTKDKFSGSHCWASVNGKYYDPLFFNSSRPKRYMSVYMGSTPQEYYTATHCTLSGKYTLGK